MKQQLVSVVMPMYNAADTVEEALRSILRQTHSNLEVLVVDDGSTDAAVQIVADHRDPRIRIVRQVHLGLVQALRNGCEQARGVCIARLDADDVANEQRIAVQVDYLNRHPEVGIVGSHARFEYADGATWRFEPPTADLALRRYLLWDNPFVHSSVMFRQTAYRRADGYAEGPNEDYRLWIRIAQTWRLAVIPEVLVTHRVRSTSYSRVARRPAALRARLGAQWEAARRLGPWHRALLALAITCGAYAMALAGGTIDTALRRRARAASARARGFRGAR